jgi:hypothetical protein
MNRIDDIQLRMRARLYTHAGVPLTNSHVL